MMSSKNASRRRRGGQIGNTNAVTHGFYSRRFRKNEVEDLENSYFSGINDEIAMLRICIRRVIEWSKDIQSLPDALDFLRTISLASSSLSRLVRTQKLIAGSGLDLAIEQAISEVSAEMGITDPREGSQSSESLESAILSSLLSAKKGNDDDPAEDSSTSESLESAILSALSGKKDKDDEHTI